jgi:glycine dehydrogenase
MNTRFLMSDAPTTADCTQTRGVAATAPGSLVVAPDVFAERHLGPSSDDTARILSALGVSSLDELLDQAVPQAIRPEGLLDLSPALTEVEAIARLRSIADENTVVHSMIGQGYYGTHVPGVILRNILENPAWYTAYTPYQPEISQGRLEALLNFQTMVADLTGMDLASASLLDEATAAAEAMGLAHRQSKSKSNRFFVDADCHPQVIAVVETRADPLGIEVVVGEPSVEAVTIDGGVFGALLAWPGSSGALRDHSAVIGAVHRVEGLACVAADLLACVLLDPPGKAGADVVIGSAQRFGVPFGYGGPHAGFVAVRDTHKRSLPGRLVGVSIDTKGRTAMRLALQTREQHIRREKATSNICTAQVLLAVMASMYACYHGPTGLKRIASNTHSLTNLLAAGLAMTPGANVVNDTWFDTLTVEVTGRADAVIAAALTAGINLRRISVDRVGISSDETTTPAHIDAVLAAFGSPRQVADLSGAPAAATDPVSAGIPPEAMRAEEILTHPTFSRYHSETEMLRYLRRLADKDLALDRTMIPLGSCTMKLNATTDTTASLQNSRRCWSRSPGTTRCHCNPTPDPRVSSPAFLPFATTTARWATTAATCV